MHNRTAQNQREQKKQWREVVGSGQLTRAWRFDSIAAGGTIYGVTTMWGTYSIYSIYIRYYKRAASKSPDGAGGGGGAAAGVNPWGRLLVGGDPGLPRRLVRR